MLQFVKESYLEFRDKVEWPKWSDLQSSTTAVAIGTVLLSIFTFGVDFTFTTAIRNLFRIFIELLN